jgi:fumarylacetoacetase
MSLLDELEIQPDSPFSQHNLPYGVFTPPGKRRPRVGVAVGEWILDLAALEAAGLLPSDVRHPALFDRPALNPFLAAGRPIWTAVRHRLQELLTAPHSPLLGQALRQRALWRGAACRLQMPATIGDYTDFYSSREHATNVGAMFRGADQALLPNWRHLPIAYHGRASSVGLGGPIHRPVGQLLRDETPVLEPTRELDFELEVGFFIGPGNPNGRPIPIDEAADHIFGLVLVNDWSARDIQRWEYRPLGPFLGKNFATSISPWVVPLAALEPFRGPAPAQEPAPLPYLHTEGEWALDIRLEARLQTAAMRAADQPAVTLSQTNFNRLYWTMPQQLAHHTVNGCPLQSGDLLASGTISGAEPGSYGSLLELSWGGRNPVHLPNGETRSFLEDGDTLTLTGWCQGDGYRVGLGEVSGTIQPPRPTAE